MAHGVVYLVLYCKIKRGCCLVYLAVYSDVYRQHKMVNSFEELLRNVFEPLFEATINPQQHLTIHKFLQFVSLPASLFSLSPSLLFRTFITKIKCVKVR